MAAMSITNARAQTFDEWLRQKKTQIAYYAEQIAALHAYHDLLVEGYTIVRDGLQVAYDLRKGEFDLHDAYFQSLRSVNPSLKTNQAVDVCQAILAECSAVQSGMQTLPSFQREYVQQVMATIKKYAGETYRQYELLIHDNQFQLTADERLRRIEATVEELRQQYAFAKRLHAVLIKLITQEAKEMEDYHALRKLFNR
jgi:hypothetical protein